MFHRVEAFVRDVSKVDCESQLVEALSEVTGDLGFQYFALVHHVDLQRCGPAVRMHNYPASWEAFFDEQGLATTDPVHRASQSTSVGFVWSRLGEMIVLTEQDQQVLASARRHGIGEGYTIPAHVPGEAHGSCSFATLAGQPICADHLALAQLVGAFAFEAARRLWRAQLAPQPLARLTDRQRECVIWAARGKSDWEIARIIDVSHETVIQHLKQARERYGVSKRTLLAVHALFDGSIGFLDVLRR